MQSKLRYVMRTLEQVIQYSYYKVNRKKEVDLQGEKNLDLRGSCITRYIVASKLGVLRWWC